MKFEILVWCDNYKINNPMLDKQHEGLFSQAKELSQNLEESSSLKFAQSALAQMAFFVIDRFKSERRIMKENDYPFFASHIAFHERFSSKLIRVIEQQSYSKQNAVEAFELICELIKHHIVSDDMVFFKWLENSGCLHQLYTFKTCTCCKKVWETLEQFIAEPQLILNGYQADFAHLSRGILLFTHSKEGCHSTLSIPIEAFIPLADDSVEDIPFSPGMDKCPGHCLIPENLENCTNVDCEGIVVRSLIQKVIKAKKNNHIC